MAFTHPLTASSTLCALLSTLLVCSAAAQPDPLPRLAVKGGRFVTPDGTEFRPRGVNYIRLHPRWHNTFSPRRYDGPRADAMLADLAKHGLNTVRVFIDHQAGEGVVAAREATELSPAYLANVCDFLARARRHRIYVIPCLLWLPDCQLYRIDRPDPARIAGGNQLFLTRDGIAAKARASADFAAAIKARDPALLSTVLAYELDNETTLYAHAPPFSLRSGTFAGLNGQAYDLASDDAKQHLADDHVVLWADASVDAIRAVDPAALVNVNVYTFAAVGRSGPAAFSKDTTRDRRFPARPLALTRTKLSYLDIHFYPFDDQTLDRDLKSIEFEALKAACAKQGLPLIMGEFGAFKKNHPKLSDAVAAMQRHLQRVRGLGFVGDLYWTYDTDEQTELWNAKSEGGVILEMLSRRG